MSEVNDADATARLKKMDEATYSALIAASGIKNAPSLKNLKAVIDQYAEQPADDNGRLSIQGDSVKAGGFLDEALGDFWGEVKKTFGRR